MEEDSADFQWSHMFVESSSLEDLQAPLKRSSRLKYNCLSVSSKLIALGSNTGGIYVFNRDTYKLLQVVFADKETGSVTMVMLSPNDRYAAFSVFSGAIYVMDLKIESRAKPETVSSVSDLDGAMVNSMHWDKQSNKLYIGDDMGRVSVMHTSKAMNLFGTQFEVLMKLDSSIVQIDKREDKLLVSTMSRCYLCDTLKQQFSQIGKKLRDGQYGACFYQPNKSTPTVYCARPGSRIWEVDFDGTVLNTHQFKQLLAIPALPVLTTEGCPVLPDGRIKSPSQSVNFPKLKILCDIYLMSWTPNRLFVFDPVNVKLILWCDKFTGIQDVRCLESEVYVYLDSMEVHCLHLLSSIKVVYLCMASEKWMVATALTLFFQENILKAVPRKMLKVESFEKLYKKVVTKGSTDMIEQLHQFILPLQNRLAACSDSENSDSARSSRQNGDRVSSVKMSDHSSMGPTEAVLHVDKNSNVDNNPSIGNHSSVGSMSNGAAVQLTTQPEGDVPDTVLQGVQTIQGVSLLQGQSSVDNSYTHSDVSVTVSQAGTNLSQCSNISNGASQNDLDLIVKTSDNTQSDDVDGKEILTQSSDLQDSQGTVLDENLKATSLETNSCDGNSCLVTGTEGGEVKIEINTGYHGDGSRVIQMCDRNGGVAEDNIHHNDEPDIAGLDPIQERENGLLNSEKDQAVPSLSNHSAVAVGYTDTTTREDDPAMLEEDEDIVSSFRTGASGSRRYSATSVTSMSSNEVFLDQHVKSDKDEPIAVGIRRKKKKKKSLDEMSLDSGSRKSGRIRRSYSAGTIQVPKFTDRSPSPNPSLHSLEEDSFPDDQTGSELQQTKSVAQFVPDVNTNDVHDQRAYISSSLPAQTFEHQEQDTLSTGTSSVLMESGDFTGSFEMSPKEGFLSGSWEGTVASSTSPRTTLSHFRNKVQTKFTTQKKKILQNIKETRNILSRSSPREEAQQTVEENVTEAETEPVAPPDGSDLDYKRDYSISESPVDISELQQCTRRTTQLLQDLAVLTDPVLTQSHLLDWISVLNRTFQKLHQTKYAQTGLNLPNKNIPETSDGGEKIDNNQSEEEQPQPCDVKDVPETETSYNQSSHKSAQNETISSIHNVLDDQQPVSAGEMFNFQSLGTSILHDKDFCYTTDPLCLPSDLLISVSALAQACFDISCHGNILRYQNLNSSQNFDNSDCDEKSALETEDKHEFVSVQNVPVFQGEANKDVGMDTAGQPLEPQQDKDENMEGEDVSDPHSDIVERKSDSVAVYGCDTVQGQDDIDGEGQGQEQSFSDDQHMAFFVRCYFPYLSVARIREKVQDVSSDSYSVWCALFPCLQVIAIDDCQRYGLDGLPLIKHILGISFQDNARFHVSLLGHLAGIVQSNPGTVVSTCVQCCPYIQPVDVLYMSRHLDVSLDSVFCPYMFQRLQDASRTHTSVSALGLCDHPDVLETWLRVLLSLSKQTNKVIADDGSARLFSNRLSWKHEKVIDDLVNRYLTPISLQICKEYGYWKGCLELMKQFGQTEELMDLVLRLGDVHLLDQSNPLGYVPENVEGWGRLLKAFSLLQQPTDRTPNVGENTANVTDNTDPTDKITWDSLGVLLVHHLGPEMAVTLLQEYNIPDSSLSTAFYRMCLLSGVVDRHQRLVLHSMLEKIDSYLWSQRSGILSPKLHYAVGKEKQMLTDKTSEQEDVVHILFSELVDEGRRHKDHWIEDQDSHWGVEARITALCPCCNIALKDSVSHVEPGVLLFRCGHGYHKVCLQDRECFLCQTGETGPDIEPKYL